MLFRSASYLKPLGLLFALLILLATSIANPVSAQGAWTPANADASFPRTLIKSGELPALRTWLEQPGPYALFDQLWSSLQGYNPPAALDNNGKRRIASFMAKNAAFFLLLDRKPGTGLPDPLTPADATQLESFAISTLERMITNVEIYPNFNEYLWRSNELINNAIAWDLLKGAGVADSLLDPSKDLLMEYAGNLYEQAAFNLFGLGFLNLHVDNHALRTCGALGVASVVLADENSSDPNNEPRKWFDMAMYNIDNVFWKAGASQSERGEIGGYSEGPHYLRFGSKHVLPFFHAMGNFLPDSTMGISYQGSFSSVRNPWHDPDYDRLFEWVLRIAMPDGRNPSLEDCFVATAWEELAIWEKSHLSPVVDYSRWAHVQPGTLWQMLHHSSDDIVADYLSAMTADQPATFDELQVLERSGNLVFRDGWDSTSTYLHFTAKNGKARSAAQGHNQADASSFILHSHGELLAIDPGYLKWDRRNEVGQAENHNMILVDGQGPAIGSTGNANGADAFIETTIDLHRLKYGEVWTEYQGTKIERRCIMTRGDQFFLSDDLYDSSPHDYTFQLHGYGLENGDSLTGTFTDLSATGQALYQKGGVNFLATLTADGDIDTYSKGPMPHEWRYDSIQNHTAFYGTTTNRSSTKFLASLIPFTQDTAVVTKLCTPNCGGLQSLQNGYVDVATVTGFASASETMLSADLSSDGTLAYYSQNPNGDFDQMLVKMGGYLTMGSTKFTSSFNRDFAMTVVDSSHYACYNDGAGTIWLEGLQFEPLSVNGLQVMNWYYDISNNILEINLFGGGYFDIHEGVVIGLDDASVDNPLQVGPNPTNGNLKAKVLKAEGTIRIMDLQGKVLLEKVVDQTEEALSLEGFEAGVYLVEWRHGRTGSVTRKVVKQ